MMTVCDQCGATSTEYGGWTSERCPSLPFGSCDGTMRLVYYYERVLADGRTIQVIPLTFGRARLAISRGQPVYGYDDGW